MDEVTLNLANFALNMHSMRQIVAARNMANVGNHEKLQVDFSEILNRIEQMPEAKQSAYLSELNALGTGLVDQLQTNTGDAVDLQEANSESTKAMLEYQALVEVINRKMGLMGTVLGGNR
ncbi:hypothetical protein KIH87_12835 [Paraneptunicella aestuarii]|uniref:flagellar basal body rod protein FlgB n=1 Tax=Paraneptunicella aestuarii TaxID=2831148 RepID=UPI001E5C8F05|nr:hypothetical protein [Paraneptunicella aestuarii]UAA37595.1 hypothetical protein KIH87_12835 [Paraneptunicella aestuarii]